MNKEKVILCRCEDVTLEEVHALLDKGYTTFEDMKRILRVGMGPCQGNTCGHLIQREISKYLGKPMEEIHIQRVRPLVMGVKLGAIVEADNES